ncbi:serine threonine-kinase SRK2H-like [Micractinium conductrix]|uniref:Serine threonine-kinase SRK2H-like n=1 Tax=Micractinium conductrix TaxID=554055 RepID=A0A2P6V3U4_9CHLO|nr:serine threonine-kinase SRK2H-like [Micractinium conductrix]|eukprot:PSC68747.1 serine threonine-kinase SRK2H-like [Micractinium conductrix]
MGACASKVREWKDETEQDEEVGAAPPAKAQLPRDGPPLPPRPQASLPSEMMFRHSQEEGLANIVRHPRIQPFQGGAAGFADYQPLRLLGRGGSGQTWLCKEGDTGKLYALKMQSRPIPRSAVRLAASEISIQAATGVSSVHSTHIKEAMLTPAHLILVLDYEAGGSAAEYVAQRIPLVGRDDLIVTEDMARLLFKQLVEGLEHLHGNHVAHRDVKLDNTLLDGETLPTVKLCDFQFAKYWGAPTLTRTKTHLGTAVYMAPELLENRQTHDSYDPVEVDVWAAGIWLVCLLCGAYPFDNRPDVDDRTAELQILQQERQGPWWASRQVRHYAAQFSPDLFDLTSRILHLDPRKRIRLEDIAAHPWMQKPLPPELESAWQRVRHAQMHLERRLSMLTPDEGLVHERNSRVVELVREAAAPLADWPATHARMTQACRASSLVDCSSEGVVRIKMQPEAVAKRLSERAVALLDTSPPGTPSRFSLPLQHIASDGSLAALGNASAEASSASLSAMAGPDSSDGGGSSGSGAPAAPPAADEPLRHLSPFVAASEGVIGPF